MKPSDRCKEEFRTKAAPASGRPGRYATDPLPDRKPRDGDLPGRKPHDARRAPPDQPRP